jgi:hypothetical protein
MMSSSLNIAQSAWCLLLVVQLCLTIVLQFTHNHTLRLLRCLSFIAPVWRLFAPKPYCADMFLISSFHAPGQETANWQRVALIGKAKWYHFLWHPSQYIEQGSARLMHRVVDDSLNVAASASILHHCNALLRVAAHYMSPPMCSRIGIVVVSRTSAPLLVFVSPRENHSEMTNLTQSV